MASQKRGFWWWATAVLAPVGVFGGPVGIAAMFQGVIQWHGVVAYVVHFWSTNISPPFEFVCAWVSNVLGLRKPPRWVVNYLIVGLLYVASYIRSASLTVKGGFIGTLRRTWWTTYFVLEYAVLWPIALVHQLLLIREWQQQNVRIHWPFLAVLYLPLLIFLSLLAVNAFILK